MIPNSPALAETAKLVESTRQQRLRTLEDDIRRLAEAIQKNGLEIGRHLVEIRENELWRGDYESWDKYLLAMGKKLVGKSFAQSANLIRAAEVAQRLPNSTTIDCSALSSTHLTELGRLAPTVAKPDGVGKSKDFSRLRTADVARVLKRAAELSGDDAPSVRDIRTAVDAELGIDRTAKAKATAAANADNHVDLRVAVDRCSDRAEVLLENLQSFTEADRKRWVDTDQSNLDSVNRLAACCQQLLAALPGEVVQ
jgi:hypothetical protein